MKKKIILIVIFAMILGSAAFMLAMKDMSHENKNKGKIEEVKEPENEKNTDFEMYKEIASYAYRGEVQYRNLIFVFKPIDYSFEDQITKYECAVLEDDDTPFTSSSLYSVTINKDELLLEYTIGPVEGTFECKYENNELTVNGVKLEKFPTSEIKDCVYNYNADLSS